MTTQTAALGEFENPRLPTQAKLAAAWTSFMFLYVYVDVLGLYKPGFVEGILKGRVWEFDITQTFAVSALGASVIPILMILLSAMLPARANRTVNLVIAALMVPWMGFNLVGDEWLIYHGLGFAVEFGLLVCILRSAWAWPRVAAAPTYHGTMTRGSVRG